MKCGQSGCRRKAEIYNLGNDRWECALHHKTNSTAEGDKRTRARVRGRRQRQELERIIESLPDLDESE